MRIVDPTQLVVVEREGVWYAGELRAWRRDGDSWRANVIYSIAVGIRHIDWVDADQVRVA